MGLVQRAGGTMPKGNRRWQISVRKDVDVNIVVSVKHGWI